MLIQVMAPHFTAGMVAENGRIVEAAPILSWAIGKEVDYLREYFKRKQWDAWIVD